MPCRRRDGGETAEEGEREVGGPAEEEKEGEGGGDFFFFIYPDRDQELNPGIQLIFPRPLN